jgi:hypothetical protein
MSKLYEVLGIDKYKAVIILQVSNPTMLKDSSRTTLMWFDLWTGAKPIS